MNSVLILVFNILASSQAEPDPDQHIHVHLDSESSKGGLTHDILDHVSFLGGESPKTGGGVFEEWRDVERGEGEERQAKMEQLDPIAKEICWTR